MVLERSAFQVTESGLAWAKAAGTGVPVRSVLSGRGGMAAGGVTRGPAMSGARQPKGGEAGLTAFGLGRGTQAALRLAAFDPRASGWMSNSTRCPSFRVRKPAASTAVA